MNTTAHKKVKQTGFTLLEVLVAISIFSIMSVVALTGIKAILDSQDGTQKVAEQIKSLQNTFFYLNQDLRYAIDRAVRDEFGDTQAAMLAGNTGPRGLVLTRAGIGNPQGVKRSDMLRVRYWLDEDRLMRSRFKMLDRSGEPVLLERTLMDKLEELEFRFLTDNNEWQPFWPPLDTNSNEKPLPRAVEISLDHQELGKIIRIIPLIGY